MAEGEHRGVGVIATNAARTRFFVQQKDEHYAPHPRGFSFFGGACEADETTSAALARELREELGEASARLLLDAEPQPLWSGKVQPNGFSYSLYEAAVDDATLDLLAARPVFEGERGIVLSREELAARPFVWGLSFVVAQVLQRARP